MTETQLVQRCRQGDREAQQELYARTADRVYAVLLRMVRNADDAAELTQDTYGRALTRLDQFQGAAGVGTWLYRIAVNEALQFLRHKRSQTTSLRSRREPIEANDCPDDRLDLESALQRLPDADRALIILKYFENMDYAEMSQVLGKPPGTIASGLNRARTMLRQLLEPEPGSPAEESGTAGHPTIRE